MKKNILFILLILLVCGCSSPKDASDEKTIYVTITPLKAIVEEITCGDFDVEVVVPDGASPETYEPTAKQLAKINEAQLIFSIGLIDFERAIIERIDNRERVVELYHGIDILEGSCSHGHHHHHHGTDPHIWTSPKSLRTMVETICNTLVDEFPDKTEYAEAADKLLSRIEELDTYCQESIERSDVKAMMIYHPAYTYYARDYGIEQIAIEHDGKEPTARQLMSLINKSQTFGINTILYQPQYSVDKVKSIAHEIGAQAVVTNPLAVDIIAEIERVTDIICERNE